MDVHDGDAAGAAPPSSDISCSICCDLVSRSGDRSRAKLQCGHEFHLDCIGSAFNMKGAMQCPICQKVEEGQWLYANGFTPPLPGSSMEDRDLDDDDDDDYEPVYSEMHVTTRWCPFGEFTGVDSSSEEAESPSTASAAQGSSTGEPNASTPHHSRLEHGSNSRVGSSFVSSDSPHHPGSEGLANGLIQTSVVFYRRPNHFNQQHFNHSRVPAPVVPGMTRGIAPATAHPQLDQTGGFYVYPPSSSSGQNLHEAQNLYPNNYSSLEGERLSRFPTITRVTGWGGYF